MSLELSVTFENANDPTMVSEFVYDFDASGTEGNIAQLDASTIVLTHHLMLPGTRGEDNFYTLSEVVEFCNFFGAIHEDLKNKGIVQSTIDIVEGYRQ